MVKRVFLIVLDSVGAGEAPDSGDFGDKGAHTLKSIYRDSAFDATNLRQLGFGNIPGLEFLGPVEKPIGAYGKLQEASRGKDTTIGHWEIAGIQSEKPLPTFPYGFPQTILDAFEKATGRGILCNRPYSGTAVIRDYGEEQRKTGKWIVYTSADSVFQIAAHTDLIPLDALYRACEIARDLLTGENAVGRVIARPFAGTSPDFFRTPDRRDFSLMPPKPTLLDVMKAGGYDVIAIGKISDIFAGRGITDARPVHGNPACMAETMKVADTDFNGLCFVNLVDFDMLYGHRNDVHGYAKAVAAFDAWLPVFRAKMRRDDVLIITADHGCDPGFPSTDHTREYVPLLMCGDALKPVSLGIGKTYADIAATVSRWFDVPLETEGTFLSVLK